MLVLDSGAVTFFARPNSANAAVWRAWGRGGLSPVVPSVVLVECLTASSRDANVNRFLKSCDVTTELPESLVRRAAALRTRAGRGSAVDAILVAVAEPGGTVLTGDYDDLSALAANAHDVRVEGI